MLIFIPGNSEANIGATCDVCRSDLCVGLVFFWQNLFICVVILNCDWFLAEPTTLLENYYNR